MTIAVRIVTVDLVPDDAEVVAAEMAASFASVAIEASREARQFDYEEESRANAALIRQIGAARACPSCGGALKSKLRSE